MRRLSVLLSFMVGLVILASAQLPPPAPPPAPPPPAVPIDGGVLLLMAAGLAYGAKKLYSKGA